MKTQARYTLSGRLKCGAPFRPLHSYAIFDNAAKVHANHKKTSSSEPWRARNTIEYECWGKSHLDDRERDRLVKQCRGGLPLVDLHGRFRCKKSAQMKQAHPDRPDYPPPSAEKKKLKAK